MEPEDAQSSHEPTPCPRCRARPCDRRRAEPICNRCFRVRCREQVEGWRRNPPQPEMLPDGGEAARLHGLVREAVSILRDELEGREFWAAPNVERAVEWLQRAEATGSEGP